VDTARSPTNVRVVPDLGDELLIMIQNLAWATGYNLISVPIAAGVLAIAGIVLAPAVGAILMSVSTIVVALTAQLLRRVDLRPRRTPDR
jgi:P-type Cu2+ transporter